MGENIKIQYTIIAWIAICMIFVSCTALSCANSGSAFQYRPRSEMLHPSTALSKIIDHTCTNYQLIPISWLDKVKALNFNVHYAHTSHGGQLITGLDEIQQENATFAESVQDVALTPDAAAFNVLNGQVNATFNETYITPDLYWQTTNGLDLTRYVLHHYPINVSMWMWCTQLDSYTAANVTQYLNAITGLESEFPNVTFVYMTGNAQAEGADGANRQQCNEQIRQYCKTNNKWLYDFGDIDCWCYTDYHTYSYNNTQVPSENPRFHGDEACHTTLLSCKIKAGAMWWLMARIVGWTGVNDAGYNPGPASQTGGYPVEVIALIGLFCIGCAAILQYKRKTA